MTDMVQVHLVHDVEAGIKEIHTVTWIEADLKPKLGMTLVCGKDPRRWRVLHAYVSTPTSGSGTRTEWKVT